MTKILFVCHGREQISSLLPGFTTIILGLI